MTVSTAGFPGFDNLFSFEETRKNSTFFADMDNKTPHVRLLRGEWKPDTVLQAHWSMGKSEPPDIALGRTVSWFYLSPRVQQLFCEYELTGWATYPIELYNRAGELCLGYAGLCITGRCGRIDRQKAQLAPGEDPTFSFPLHVGMYFDESTWDGSDFFCPEGGTANKFVTRRVKELFEEHRIRGFTFSSLPEATWIP